MKRWPALGYACAGLAVLYRSQIHARVHLLATAAVVALGLALPLARWEWSVLVLAMALVWVAEALNTALEFLADAAVPERHPLIRQAKDVAAGAVLLAALGALTMALLVFSPHLAVLL